MGIFFSSFEQMGPPTPGTPGYTAQTLGMKETFKQMVKHTYARGSSQAKSFGVVGALFAGTECLIENVGCCLMKVRVAVAFAVLVACCSYIVFRCCCHNTCVASSYTDSIVVSTILETL